MADPVVTLHDSGGTLIPEGTPVVLPTATPGVPTADTVISVRNNDAAGPAVDPARDVKLSILARAKGSSAEPVASGLPFLDARALEVQVTAVSGGATAAIVTYRPLGKGRTLSLSEIPDGGIVTLGIRINATLAATLTDVELFLLVESLQATPLQHGTYEAFGNFIYNGEPGGVADPTFTAVRTITGDLQPDSPNDDSVDTWTRVVYVLEGVEHTYAPLTPEIVFTGVDGDAATLLDGEAYYAAITLDGSGTAQVTKGSKNTAPLTDADKPTPPADELLGGWVVVPFGLVITTVEDVLDLDFFGATQTGGLGVDIGPGRGLVGDYRWDSETTTSLTLADDETTRVYVRPSGGLEQVTSGSDPADPHSMLIWTYLVASGTIVTETDNRRIGSGVVTGGQASLGFQDDRHRKLFGADYSATGTFKPEAVTGVVQLSTSSWRQITPYGDVNDNPLLLPGSGINLKAASSDTDDDGSPAGNGAQTLRAIYLDDTGARNGVDVTMDGQTEAAVNAASIGLVSARVTAVGSTGKQEGDIAFGATGVFTLGVPSTYHGKIPLELPFAPTPSLGDPAGVTTGMVFFVPTSHVAALSKLTIAATGPVLVQIFRKDVLGPHVVMPVTPFGPGSQPVRWESPIMYNDNDEPAAIPAHNWIYVTAIALGSGGHVGGRLEVILLETS